MRISECIVLKIFVKNVREITVCTVLMRNEKRKEERSKQGQTNKQGKATQHTQDSHFP